MLEKAIQIAIKAHQGQKDKAGKPYILHLLRVMLMGKTEEEMICGVLHDIVEDTHYTFDDLKKEGFNDRILEALKCVTKVSENEDYQGFINRIKLNPLAIKVKLNDLKDNMNLDRLSNITEKDKKRRLKYQRAFDELSKVC